MSAFTRTAALAVALSLPLSVFASPQRDGRRRGPPPEAIEACADRTEGEACSFTMHDETVSGTCEAGPRADLPLACRPTDAPPPR